MRPYIKLSNLSEIQTWSRRYTQSSMETTVKPLKNNRYSKFTIEWVMMMSYQNSCELKLGPIWMCTANGIVLPHEVLDCALKMESFCPKNVLIGLKIFLKYYNVISFPCIAMLHSFFHLSRNQPFTQIFTPLLAHF